jgi:hypothetical protein
VINCRALPLLCACLGLAAPSSALVLYDEGRRVIEGVQLLQDASDPKAFYYLPQFPRLSQRPGGDGFEFVALKYVGSGGVASGGLFHALVEFTLPPELEARVAEKLRSEVDGAALRGPVPLLEAVESGSAGVGSFRVVSATLANAGKDSLARSLVTSGRAPLTPGSKAVIAALLSPEGATLLWETLSGPTSDVSVAITAYYEAQVKAYGARVTADVDTVYEHFSRFSNRQQGFEKEELRKITDELVRTSAIRIEVLDRSAGLGVDAKAMQGLVDLVTQKLTDLMFDAEAGWSRTPTPPVAVEADQIRGRQEAGWLQKTLGIGTDQPYYTDNQFVLKDRKDIQSSRFALDLSQSTTIRVPVDSSGNLGGLYRSFGDDPRYFRIVNLADPVFEHRTVHFQIDGGALDAFQDTINFVTVNFRKRYAGEPTATRSLVFSHDEVRKGRTVQSVEYPRLGDASASWLDYEYQVRWSVRDRPTIALPADETQWLRASDPAIALVPPFERRVVEVDADRALFGPSGVAAAVVEFAVPLAGKPKLMRKATLRPSDAEASRTISLYGDRDAEVGWRVTWHTKQGPQRSDAKSLDSEYLYLVPPPLVAADTSSP